MSTSGVAPLISLDAAGRLDADVPCLRCGYNLRTLLPEAACPECGHSVAAAMEVYGRFDSAPGRLRALMWGIDLLVVRWLLAAVTRIVLMVLQLAFAIPLYIRWYFSLRDIAFSTLVALGVWLITRPRRYPPEPRWLATCRWLARGIAVALVGYSITGDLAIGLHGIAGLLIHSGSGAIVVAVILVFVALPLIALAARAATLLMGPRPMRPRAIDYVLLALGLGLGGSSLSFLIRLELIPSISLQAGLIGVGLLMAAAIVLLCLYLREMAGHLERRRVARQFLYLAWGQGALALLSSLMSLLIHHLVVARGATGAAFNQPWFAPMSVVLSVIDMAHIAWAIWIVVLLLILRRELSKRRRSALAMN